MTTGNNDLSMRKVGSIEQLKTAVGQEICGILGRENPRFSEMPQDLMLALVDAAGNVKGKKLTREDELLVKSYKALTAVNGAVEKGLVRESDEAESLADALVYSQMNPANAIKYLEEGRHSKLTRLNGPNLLSPRELIGALEIHADFSGIFKGISVAKIVQAADQCGIRLGEFQVSDEDLHLIASALNEHKISIGRSVDRNDPIDGPFSELRVLRFIGQSIVSSSQAVTPLRDDERSDNPGTRIRSFNDFAGLDEDDL